jgi:hypothetical protein
VSSSDGLTTARLNHYHEEPVGADGAGLDSLRICDVYTMAFEAVSIASGGLVGKIAGPWTSVGIAVDRIASVRCLIFHRALNQLFVG